ncbi:NUDIX hydrolase [Actinomadura atramentaria]|uniref:NUDIX hydrolase n=1 Tax=Actinomadura atramentaria TaxID=1990 RepID=UPI00037C916A|nr:NUDIX hydrolase [Actinomadura atramentaria]
MRHAVRAVLLTPSSDLLLMKRTRPNTPPYWVLIGGGVEPDDPTPEDALRREIREEIGGEAKIVKHLHTIQTADTIQDIYLATITSWNFNNRTGPEFTDSTRGKYELEQHHPDTIKTLNIKPPALKPLLHQAPTQASTHENPS